MLITDSRLTNLKNQVDLLEVANLSGMIGFESKAVMDAALNYPSGALALVTNDPDPNVNTIYRKEGVSGSGSWVKIL